MIFLFSRNKCKISPVPEQFLKTVLQISHKFPAEFFPGFLHLVSVIFFGWKLHLTNSTPKLTDCFPGKIIFYDLCSETFLLCRLSQKLAVYLPSYKPETDHLHNDRKNPGCRVRNKEYLQ